ncbi:purine-cytosine permease FCY21 [Pyricularia oryzae 70-15]|uniref:Purine-cytosine permease FCY21 n=1 Tax=Pyricularia oryzae (strain 70-15 / ATCC MYA-4617 / FGSC 8958) TaxID=242507 RepID=G4NE56_PYRO7|nr:purine-cytosine permease FCY21 [Pyricularia oryzae 70-15]EHA49385.1 purine-cytosine permease FCY21 [Pyricularia oryzae 70-15]KAI7920835.1 purine-cytosine permease FCY21 [Pyricularia oryzae]KAI7927063.1 purine-cytosine permease FCY21 [Pyricularia oryzae]
MEDPEVGHGWRERAQRAVGRLGIEQRGIERVPEDERSDVSITNMGSLWLSANMTVATFAVGMLARPVFKLGFFDAALTIIFINMLGTMPVAFFATFGPRFGLRQMILSRFWFGYNGVKFITVFNIMAGLGWSSVNCIVGAQLLHTVNSSMPGYAGVLVISLSTLAITTFGYKIVHLYEKYAWIPVFIIFVIVAGVFSQTGDFNSLSPLATGPDEAGAVLSFGASIFGFATGWAGLSADYTVYQPATRSRATVFAVTFAGLFLPLCFNEILGAAVMTASATNIDYVKAYSESQVGGVLGQVLIPPLGRFGSFCLVLLALSIIANNCPNIYSVSLSVQVLASSTQRVPRFIWTMVATVVYIAISIPGYDNFEAWLSNFMVIIGYWLAAYEAIALVEHFAFRRGYTGYDPDQYTDPDRLPPGYAALAAFVCGASGAILGMKQLWYTGPIARLVGSDGGGDLGFELAFAFAAVAYLGLRMFEKRRFGR